MITSQQLAESFALNARLLKLHTEGLSHADSLAQTPYNINCMNWVIGHMLVARDRVLALLQTEPVLSPAERSRYETDSHPIKEDGEGVIPLDRLLSLLDAQQQRITTALTKTTPEQLAEEQDAGVTLGRQLFGLYFHDTYHTGQIDLLRQVAGKNDRIV